MPDTGVLFFVLPKRCIYSHCVGGVKNFSSLLNGLGLHELMPCRETPKLIFYILGNASQNGTTTDPIQPQEHQKQLPKKKNKLKANSDEIGQGGMVNNDKDCKTKVVREAWHERARSNIAKNMSKDVFLHFSRDFSDVPANKFAIALPSQITDGLF